MRFSLFALLLTLAACDDGEATPAQQGADAAVDAAVEVDAAPDAVPPAALPMSGDWRIALVFPDLGVRLTGTLALTTEARTLGFDLRLIAEDGTTSDVLATVADAAVDAAGGFEVVLDGLTIPPAFSPTGSALLVHLELSGTVRDAAFFCGTATGREQTLMLDLGAGTFAATPAGGPAPPASCDGELMGPDVPTVGGDRPARVLLPADYTPEDGPRPLILFLHGFGANSAQEDAYLGIGAQRDTQGYIVVLPEGTTDPAGEQFWNATPACCDNFGAGVDDVAYLTELLDETASRFRVDPRRIYLMGHSNGGFMSYRLACALGDRIAALVVLAGSTLVDEAACLSTTPVSVLHVHARDDATIAFGGDPDPVEGYPGASETAQRWATRAGCAEPPAEDTTLDLVASVPGAETHVTAWSGCADDTEVQLWALEAGGHVPTFGPRWADTVLPWLLAKRRPE